MMVNLSKFVKEYTPLCVCTLGLAVLGYLGYHAVRWIINKCNRTEKIDRVAKNHLSNINCHLSAYSSKLLSKRVEHDTLKTYEVNAAKKTELHEKHSSEKEYVKLKRKLKANREELIEKSPLMGFLCNQKKLTETQWLSNIEVYGYALLIAIEYPELYPWNWAPYEANALSDSELQKKFLKSNCRYLFNFVNVSDSHWTLLLVDKQLKTVEYYDSKHNYGGEDYKTTIKEAKQIAKDFDYTFEEKIAKSIQPDGYQCGIWVLYFLEKRINNPNISFDTLSNASKIIANFRKHVSDSLLIINQVLKEV